MKNNKTKRLYFRCTESEYKFLEKKSANFQSMSVFIRKLIFGKNKTVIEPKIFMASVDLLAREIKKVGVNVNQTARYINYAERSGIVSDEILEAIRADFGTYQVQLDKIKEGLYEMIKTQLT